MIAFFPFTASSDVGRIFPVLCLILDLAGSDLDDQLAELDRIARPYKGEGRSYARASEWRQIRMLLLLSNPRIGLSLALEASISAGESTEFIDVDGERAVPFRDDPIISHASNMACDRVSANVLDGRFAKRANRGKHDFAFSGLIKCAMRLRGGRRD